MCKIKDITNYDINGTDEILRKYDSSRGFKKYGKVYFETNEDCDKLISKFDVTNKKVLTVLGSSDQAFQFYLNGAKEVDFFDINKLTIYYYYLRIWNMKVNGTIYPEWGFDNNYINKLLESVKPSSKNELIAYRYWSKYIKRFNSKQIYRLFFYPYDRKLYNDIDVSSLLQRIDMDNPNFYNKDISRIFDIPESYDLIYTSNLSDYLDGDRIHIYRDNLYKHLNKGGIILSSCICSGPDKKQHQIMKYSFKHKDIVDDGNYIGYYYKKRKIKRII